MESADPLLTSLDVMVNYGQVTVYLPSIERPGHVWGEAELEQGFAWTSGIVSFGMPEHSEACRVEILATSSVVLSADAVSAVSVPFEVTASFILVGSVFYFDEVPMDRGAYRLVAEVLPWHRSAITESEDDPDCVLRLHFLRSDDDAFAILKAGGAVRSDRVLSTLSQLA